MMLNVVCLLLLTLSLTHGAMTVHTFGSSDAAVAKLAAAYEKSATVIFGPILSHPGVVSDVYIYDAAREATDKATWVTAICNNKMHNEGQDPNCAGAYNNRPSMQTVAAAGQCGPPGTVDLSKCAGMVMHAGSTSGASSDLAESLVIPQRTFDLPSPLEGKGCCDDGGEKIAIHESWHLVSFYLTQSYTTREGFAGGNPDSGTAQPYFGPYWLNEGMAEYVALTRAALIPGYGYNLTQTLAHSFTGRRQQLIAHPECRLAGMHFLGEASWDGPCAGKVDFINLGAWATALMVAKNLALPTPAGGKAQGERAILVDLLVETSQRNLMPGVGFKEKVGMTVAAFEKEVEALFLVTPPLSAAALFDKLFPQGPPTSVSVDFTGLTVAKSPTPSVPNASPTTGTTSSTGTTTDKTKVDAGTKSTLFTGHAAVSVATLAAITLLLRWQ